MKRIFDGSVRLSKGEVKSLAKLLRHVNSCVGSLVNDGDWLGWSHYRALDMWEDVLWGEIHELDYYVDDSEQYGWSAATVREWLEGYGIYE